MTGHPSTAEFHFELDFGLEERGAGPRHQRESRVAAHAGMLPRAASQAGAAHSRRSSVVGRRWTGGGRPPG